MPTMMQIRSFVRNHFIHILIYQLSMFSLLFLYLSLQTNAHDTSQASHLDRRWGPLPITQHCNDRFRTATLLSYLLGGLGVDQFYAHHWVLGVFKLLTIGGLGFWWFIDIIMWIVGAVYGLPGCGGGVWWLSWDEADELNQKEAKDSKCGEEH